VLFTERPGHNFETSLLGELPDHIIIWRARAREERLVGWSAVHPTVKVVNQAARAKDMRQRRSWEPLLSESTVPYDYQVTTRCLGLGGSRVTICELIAVLPSQLHPA
jgi:hypothetical protein